MEAPFEKPHYPPDLKKFRDRYKPKQPVLVDVYASGARIYTGIEKSLARSLTRNLANISIIIHGEVYIGKV